MAMQAQVSSKFTEFPNQIDKHFKPTSEIWQQPPPWGPWRTWKNSSLSYVNGIMWNKLLGFWSKDIVESLSCSMSMDASGLSFYLQDWATRKLEHFQSQILVTILSCNNSQPLFCREMCWMFEELRLQRVFLPFGQWVGFGFLYNF